MRILRPLSRRRNHRMWINHPRRCTAARRRYGHSTMWIAPHRAAAELSRCKARNPSAGRYSNFRGTRFARHRSAFLHLHGIELSTAVARHRDSHARHVIADVKRFFILCGLHCAFTRGLHLRVGRLHGEASAICRAAPGNFHQFLLDRVRRLHSRAGTSTRSLVAADRNNNHRRQGENNHVALHDGAIVIEPCERFGDAAL